MYKALYLHIPFCKQRCAYCDFVTEALPADSNKMDTYLEFLIKEIRSAVKANILRDITTVYIGGGTPTFFGHGRLVELAYTLSLSLDMAKLEEFTVEANPDSITPALVKDLYALGVNRLSIGVQSFVDQELSVLKRAHDEAQAVSAIVAAQERYENISIDLMCGIPGQSRESWQYSLEKALSLGLAHISIYPLQIEEGTPLALAIERGELEEPSEDSLAESMLAAAQVLEDAGYHRYEIASYAKPDRESKHNICYWSGTPYLGIGRGAASMQNNPNGSRLRTKEGEESELLSAKEAVAEDLFLAMRMSNGIEKSSLNQLSSLLPNVHACFAEMERIGLVSTAGSRYKPTEKGWLLGNELFARIWELASS